MASKKLKCIVCGRIFYHGQGITLTIAGKELHFHSKKCALNFFKSMILYLDEKDLEKAVTATLKEYEERLREIEERSKKSIEKLIS